MPERREVTEAKLAVKAAENLYRVAMTDMRQPRVLEEQLAQLQAQRDQLDAKIEAVQQRIDNRQEAYDQASANLDAKRQELIRLKHKVKYERLQRELDKLKKLNSMEGSGDS